MTWKMLSAMALLASGCRTPDSVLLATLDCDPGTPPSYSIKVALSEPGGHDDTKIFPASPSGPLAFPTSLALIIPRDRSGILDLAFLALDAGSRTVAHATSQVILEEGAQTDTSLTLSAGDDLCGNQVLDPGEGCDDGNLYSFDGCDYGCRLESPQADTLPDAGTDDLAPTQPSQSLDASPSPDLAPSQPDASPSPDIQPPPKDLAPDLAPAGSYCTHAHQCASGNCMFTVCQA